ncbi:uncharacterized protein [Prorops nasuta]|uniref:uncharacterized protein n=1 Tax=Prorops nasuta TaxID=863751 RepID=UPI0034CD8729
MPTVNCGLCGSYVGKSDLVRFCKAEEHGYHSTCLRNKLKLGPKDAIPNYNCHICNKTANKASPAAAGHRIDTASHGSMKCGNDLSTAQDNTVTALLTNINDKFESINTRLSKIDDLTAKVDSCILKLDAMASRVDTVENAVTELRSACTVLDTRLTAMELEPDINDDMQRDLIQVDARVTQLEFQLNRSQLIFSGLPVSQEMNDLLLIQKLLSVLKTDVGGDQIRNIRRLRSSDPKRPGNISVRFTGTPAADSVLSARRKIGQLTANMLNSAFGKHNIYINKSIPPLLYKLLRDAKTAAKSANYRHVWLDDQGIVRVKKDDSTPAVTIRSAKDLANINL